MKSNKVLKIAVQMDALDKLDIEKDTTICLIKEALSRKFEVWYYTCDKLFLDSGEVIALANKISIKNNEIILHKIERINLLSIDVVLMRQNPPMDMNYITSTYILEKIHPKTLVVNSPAGVRDMPEKLFICNYPDIMPPTIVTRDFQVGEEFLLLHKDIIIKPLYSFGGKDILKISFVEDNNSIFKKNFDRIQSYYESPVMLQEFLSEVKKGDKRVLLLDGEVVGVINRVPQLDSIKANLCAGGRAEKGVLGNLELEHCKIIGAKLKERGIILAGLDIIGEYITEVNVTSATGVQTTNELYSLVGSAKIENRFWDLISTKCSSNA